MVKQWRAGEFYQYLKDQLGLEQVMGDCVASAELATYWRTPGGHVVTVMRLDPGFEHYTTWDYREVIKAIDRVGG